jgi:hypothetical protein
VKQDADAQTIATTMRERGDKVFSSGKKNRLIKKR